jgi:hypothetical protein
VAHVEAERVDRGVRVVEEERSEGRIDPRARDERRAVARLRVGEERDHGGVHRGLGDDTPSLERDDQRLDLRRHGSADLVAVIVIVTLRVSVVVIAPAVAIVSAHRSSVTSGSR